MMWLSQCAARDKGWGEGVKLTFPLFLGMLTVCCARKFCGSRKDTTENVQRIYTWEDQALI